MLFKLYQQFIHHILYDFYHYLQIIILCFIDKSLQKLYSMFR